MAEFCVDCWNKMNETDYSSNRFVISKEIDLCEGCGEFKNVIIREKEHNSLFSWLFDW